MTDQPDRTSEQAPPGGGGRNLKLAVVTGLVLASAVLGLLYLGATPFFGLVAAILLIAQAEFYVAARRAGHDPAIALGMVAGGVMLVGAYTRGEAAAGLVLVLMFLFSFVWYLSLEKRRRVVGDLAATILGVAYIPLLGTFAVLLLRRPDGRGAVMAMIAAAVLNDVLAYAGGSRFGKRLIAARISPHKTLEGFGIATLGTVLLAPPLIAIFSVGPWNYPEAVVLAVAISIAAPFGDLFVSLVKRDLGIKDMGSLLPGHGGALDRVDGILMAAPAAYLSLRIFGL